MPIITTWLIAHKVRGEIALDIASQIQVDGYDEPWWIIPTSGHRAYPFWSRLLVEDVPDMSDYSRDHYEGQVLPRTEKFTTIRPSDRIESIDPDLL
jgi:hypothetical protein